MTLEILQETEFEAFKAYMKHKTKGWFRRWGCNSTSAVAASRPDAGSTYFTYEKCFDIFYIFRILFTCFTYDGP